MIKMVGVSKRYKKYLVPYGSLKSYILHIKEYIRLTSSIEDLNVISDLSLEVPDGEVLCIIGKNGSGKSTIAKMLAGTVTPDTGEIITEGRIVPFLELGVAFNPELSGYDNVFLNGVLLGMSRKYLKEHIYEIFEYAEVTDFMNTPIKYYSSGMLVRLAFSIGMHAQGDIYIFDEILAVGDANFQKKCFDSFHDLIKNKKTVVMITHDIGLVKKYATMVLKLQDGLYEFIEDKDKIQEL